LKDRFRFPSETGTLLFANFTSVYCQSEVSLDSYFHYPCRPSWRDIQAQEKFYPFL